MRRSVRPALRSMLLCALRTRKIYAAETHAGELVLFLRTHASGFISASAAVTEALHMATPANTSRSFGERTTLAQGDVSRLSLQIIKAGGRDRNAALTLTARSDNLVSNETRLAAARLCSPQ